MVFIEDLTHTLNGTLGVPQQVTPILLHKLSRLGKMPLKDFNSEAVLMPIKVNILFKNHIFLQSRYESARKRHIPKFCYVL